MTKKYVACVPVLPALLLPPTSIPLLPLYVSAPSLLFPFRPAPATLCDHKANKSGKVLERDEERVGPVSFRSVPFRPVPATLCTHKANNAGKVSERDEGEEQKPKHLAELTLVLPFWHLTVVVML